jgi:hypothetical protein
MRPPLFSNVMQEAEDRCRMLDAERLSRKRVYSYGTVAAVSKQRSAGSGEAQLDALFQLLDSFGLKRSRVQMQLHVGMAGSVLQRIFSSDSDADMRLAMNKHKIPGCRQQFMAITPRRFGKTTAVSMFVAAFAIAVPGSQTAIFSTGRRASNLLLQQIKSMICQALTQLLCVWLTSVVPDTGGRAHNTDVQRGVDCAPIGCAPEQSELVPGKSTNVSVMSIYLSNS